MDDRVLGGLILIISIIGLGVYFWLVFLSPWAWLTIQVSAYIAVGAMLLILAWIGYTMATTPPPVPLEDLDIDTEEFDFDWEDEDFDEDIDLEEETTEAEEEETSEGSEEEEETE
ncbi:MAG: transcriptional regulator [Candidatus Bathyarchaeia archaeon]